MVHVEKREMARDALKESAKAAGIAGKSQTPAVKKDPRLKKKVKCGGCMEIIAQFAMNRNGTVGERKLCAECWRQSKKSHNMKTRGDERNETASKQHALEDPDTTVPGQTSNNAIMISTVSCGLSSLHMPVAAVVGKKSGRVGPPRL